jgi:hypothetical protein
MACPVHTFPAVARQRVVRHCAWQHGPAIHTLTQSARSRSRAGRLLLAQSPLCLLFASSHPRLDQAKGDDFPFASPDGTRTFGMRWDHDSHPIHTSPMVCRPIHRSSAPPSPSARSCPPCDPSSRHTLDTRTMHNHHLQSLRHSHRMSTTEHAVIRTGAL